MLGTASWRSLKLWWAAFCLFPPELMCHFTIISSPRQAFSQVPWYLSSCSHPPPQIHATHHDHPFSQGTCWRGTSVWGHQAEQLNFAVGPQVSLLNVCPSTCPTARGRWERQLHTACWLWRVSGQQRGLSKTSSQVTVELTDMLGSKVPFKIIHHRSLCFSCFQAVAGEPGSTPPYGFQQLNCLQSALST